MKTFTITKSDIDEAGWYTGNINTAEELNGNLVIEADLGRVRFNKSLRVKGLILAKCGTGIEAGWGIKAGLTITAKCISSGLRIFAGIATWKKPDTEEMQIRAKLIDGEIAFGELVEPVEVERAG